MTSFMQKLRTITLGSINDLLDKQIDANSPTMVRQYVRDLEDALDKMRNEDAIQAGAVRTLVREKGDLMAKIETTKKGIATILEGTATNKTELARLHGTTVVQMQSQLDAIQADLDNQRKTSEAISSALVKLDMKHAQAVLRLRELEHLDRDSKIKESAASAMSQVSKIMGDGVDTSVDDIASKMRARNDVASVKFDRAMDSMKTEEDPDTAAAVDNLLAELQPKEAKTA